VTEVSSFGKFSDADLKLAKQHIANRRISASLHEAFAEKLDSDPVVERVWELVEKRLEDPMKKLFGPCATLSAKGTDWERALDALESKGLFGMLGKDGDLLRALAAIGLMNTFTQNDYLIRSMSKLLEVDESDLDRAMNLLPVDGFPFVARKGDQVVALV
jgi:hypothetical protein